jgi:hypothetical protein
MRAGERARAHTQREICKTYFFSTATMVSQNHLNITLYVHCLSCSFISKTPGYTKKYCGHDMVVLFPYIYPVIFRPEKHLPKEQQRSALKTSGE